MARAAFEIGDTAIAPGEHKSLALDVPGQSAFTPLSMPVHVVHGRRDGPVLFISAAIHGDEINGIEIIRQLRHNRALSRLRGTLICVPIVNVYGFLNHTRYLPDRRDLNRSFPGSEHGSLAARMADIFATEIVQRATHGIDLHTGANHRVNLPHIRANMDHEECKSLAMAFGTPVAISANLRDGSLRQYALEKGITMLLYEAGEALRFDKLSVRAGVRGILNVMRALGMLPARKAAKAPEVVIASGSEWVRAPQTGLLRIEAPLGARVEKGQPVGKIADAVGDNEVSVLASATGIIVGRTNLPVTNEGDALFHIARFSSSAKAERAVDAFHDEHIEGLKPGDYPEPGMV